MNFPIATTLAVLAMVQISSSVNAATSELKPSYWPQFRGPNASGIAADNKPAPVEFGPNKHLAWKTALPVGHSSPCIWDNRIFLTGYRTNDQKLETLSLDRTSGTVLWQREVPAEKIEWINQWMSPNNPASPTPATNGKYVVAYFGSYGLIAYDFTGKTLWEMKLPPGKSMHGTGSSPIIVGDLVILDQHLTASPCLLAVRLADGHVAWKAPKEAVVGVGPRR